MPRYCEIRYGMVTSEMMRTGTKRETDFVFNAQPTVMVILGREREREREREIWFLTPSTMIISYIKKKSVPGEI